MPNHTYIAKEEKTAPGHKASKERLTLLLGGNAAGGYKLKLLLVYQAENPRVLKGWVTLQIFEDWFTNHFVPEVERYCASKGLLFKVLLVLNNALVTLPVCMTFIPMSR